MTDESARDDATLYEIAAEDRSAVSGRFDDFRVALEALCIEHGVRITGSRDYDDYSNYLELATEDDPAGCEIDFENCIPPTPEEVAAENERRAKENAEHEARMAEYMRKRDELHASPEYQALRAEANRDANRKRNDYMRISTDPIDPAYIDARPRRVWVNNVEVLNWLVADEFRRCVITAAGVMNGAVLIERLGEPGAPVVEAPAEASTSLSGMFVKVPDVAPVEAPAPTFAVETVPVKAAAMSAKPAKKKRSR